MKFSDLITIAIPCYERREYIKEALESAMNQTVKCKIIVVDNASSHDYFKKLCEEKGVTYYRNETNIGLFPNINRCYELADTEYVKVLDDDDILLPTYVESFLKAHTQHPDIDVFYTNYWFLTSKGKKSNKEILPFGYFANGSKILENGIHNRLGFPYMTSAVKKSRAKLDLDQNICMGGYDWVWVYANANELSFFGDSQKLHKYRMHENKASRGKDWNANILTYLYIYGKVMPGQISDPKLKKRVKRAAFKELVFLKSYGSLKEFDSIMKGDNRFGNYLKERIDKNLFIRIISKLPQKLSLLFFLVFVKTNRLIHKPRVKINETVSY